MDTIQQFNFHLLAGDVHKFRLFEPPPPEEAPFELAELVGHVRFLRGSAQPAPSSSSVEVDAGKLEACLSRVLFGRVVAANELLEVQCGDHVLLVRVTAAHVLGEAEREEAVGERQQGATGASVQGVCESVREGLTLILNLIGSHHAIN